MGVVRALAIIVLAAVAPAYGTSAALAQGTGSVPSATTQALAGKHPAEYYKQAAALFEAGKKDDAVFVFYLGQLHYRIHLLARPTLAPDGDPALFASLSEVVGSPINEYAFGDIPALARTIDAVLAYDEANPDTFTSPVQFAQAHTGVRGGLAGMKAKMLAAADAIRAQRLKNGLENRN